MKTAKIDLKALSTAETTTVDLVIRLQVAGSPADVMRYRAALEALAEVMVVQAEDGLWSLGFADAEIDDGPSEYVADIDRARVHTILIDTAADVAPTPKATQEAKP